MSTMTTLCSLAMLKVRIDQGGDYLGYLEPYVIHVLANNRPEIVNDATVAELLLAECGLQIPQRTVQVVLQRLAKRGYLQRAHHVYTVTASLPAQDYTPRRRDAEKHIEDVIDALQAYALEASGKTVSDEEAMECLTLFLSNFSVNCLAQYLRGTTLPEMPSAKNWQLTLARQFVSHIQHDEKLFDEFMTIVQGHMLANALLCPDLASVANNFADVTFYLDTKLLLRLLGLDGVQQLQATTELVSLLKSLRGTVAYFAHTRDELFHVIRHAADRLNDPESRQSVVLEARKSGHSKSDLILIAEQLTADLAALGVAVHSRPPYDPATYRFEIDEKQFADVLDKEVGNNPKAVENDTQSVRSIFVLRRGTTPDTIEKCKAVLVTSNGAFADAAHRFGLSHETGAKVSPVVTDYALANIAWLKAPSSAPALPRREVLAFAYAALRPTNAFWSRMLEEAERLEKSGQISELQHQLLRSSCAVQEDLAKLTLGDDKALTAESFTRTLGRVTDEIRHEERAKRLETERERDEAHQQREQYAADAQAMRQRIYNQFDKRALFEAQCLGGLVFGLLVASVIGGWFVSPWPVFKYLSAAASAVAVLWGLCDWWWGVTIKELVQRFRGRRHTQLLQRHGFVDVTDQYEHLDRSP